MDTSHSKNKRPRPPAGSPLATDRFESVQVESVHPESTHPESVHPKSIQKDAFLISIAVKEDARPFGSIRAGEFVPNDRGRALADCWRELGRVGQGILPDALLVGPRHVQGILILSPDGKKASSLSDAVRLFKVIAYLRLSQSSQAQANRGAPRNIQAARISSATETSVLLERSPSALWKKGYTERPLAGPSDLTEARKALKAWKALNRG